MNLANVKNVRQTPTFRKTVKKLNKNEKMALDSAIKDLMKKPDLGVQKKGDLAFLRVYKFRMNKQMSLLGYSYDDETLTLELMALGSHENFYRDVKRII